MKENIEIIRTACIKANPNKFEFGVKKNIGLCDVLLAIGSNSVLKINNLGGFSWFIDNEWKDIATPRYNLLKDDLREQSEETISFLAGLLSANK